MSKAGHLHGRQHASHRHGPCRPALNAGMELQRVMQQGWRAGNAPGNQFLSMWAVAAVWGDHAGLAGRWLMMDKTSLWAIRLMPPTSGFYPQLLPSGVLFLTPWPFIRLQRNAFALYKKRRGKKKKELGYGSNSRIQLCCKMNCHLSETWLETYH